MPGETFDEKSARQNREAAAEAERERLYREQAAREAAIAWERLKAILRGERPTRDSNEDWLRARGGMLPLPPAPPPGIPGVNGAFPPAGYRPSGGMLPPPAGGIRG